MIFYITHTFSGIHGLVYGEATDATGRPGFTEPYKFISAHEDIKVLLLAPEKPRFSDNTLGWNDNNVIFIKYRKGSPWQIFDEIKSFVKTVWMCKVLAPKFIYCHGAISYAGLIAGRILGIKTGLRLYGTFLVDVINSPISVKRAIRFLQHWREIFAMKIPKAFVLMLNDGTRGNEALRYFNAERKSNVYFWLNGVDHAQNNVTSEYTNSSELIYPARITPWKRQDRALTFFKEALRVEPNLKLSFVGKIQSKEYFEDVMQFVKDHNLEANVTFRGEIPQKELAELMVESLGVLSFYDVANLGNVAIECLSLGGCLIALDDGSLNGIISNGINGHVVSSSSDFGKVIKSLISSSQLREDIAANARISSRKLFNNWPERSLREYDLIKSNIGDN